MAIAGGGVFECAHLTGQRGRLLLGCGDHVVCAGELGAQGDEDCALSGGRRRGGRGLGGCPCLGGDGVESSGAGLGERGGCNCVGLQVGVGLSARAESGRGLLDEGLVAWR